MTSERTTKVWHSSEWRDGAITTRELTTTLRRTYSEDGCQEIVTGPEGETRRRLPLRPLAAPPRPAAGSSPAAEGIAADDIATDEVAADESAADHIDVDDIDVGGVAPDALTRLASDFDAKARGALRGSGVTADRVVVRADRIRTTWSREGGEELSLGPRFEHHLYFGVRCVSANGTPMLASRHSAVRPVPDQVPEMAAELEERLRHENCRPISTGEYPVMLTRGISGLFAHECLGHLLEVDLADSVLVKRYDRRIGSAAPFDLDDEPESPYLAMRWDDEGVPAPVVRLISEGIVTGLISDRARGTADGFGRLTTTGLRPRMRNLRLRGSAPAEFEPPLTYVRPILPIRAGCRGTRFAMLFGGGLLVDGDRETKVGPLVVSGNVLQTLERVCFVGRTGEWLMDGGLCGKGGGEPLFVGAWGPEVMVTAMHCSAIDLERLAARPTRVEDISG